MRQGCWGGQQVLPHSCGLERGLGCLLEPGRLKKEASASHAQETVKEGVLWWMLNHVGFRRKDHYQVSNSVVAGNKLGYESLVKTDGSLEVGGVRSGLELGFCGVTTFWEWFSRVSCICCGPFLRMLCDFPALLFQIQTFQGKDT